MDPRSLDPDVDPNTGNSSSNTVPIQRKSSMISNLQPRAAATIDFNEDSDEEDGGLLSADYKAQKKTTQDLIDFFKSAPPPSPPRMPPIEEEKKKRSLLQRLRPRKSGSNLTNGAGGNGSSISMGNGNRRSSVLVPPGGGTSSNISSISGVTTGKGKNGEDITTATLPNGRKYIMIAVDYKEGEGGAAAPGATALASATGSISSRRQSRIPDDIDGSMLGGSKATSLMGKNILAESAMGIHGGGGDRRRSVIPQSGNGEASKFVLENGPFLLDDFAIESDFIAQDGATASKTASETGATVVTEALSQRIASHKARQQHQISSNEAVDSNASTHHDKDFLDIVLPKPVSRKKVRHVQIQTQHCVMRPMHTQTEPYESLVQDTEVKDWSTQTNGSVSGSTEVGSSTFDEGSAASSKDATTATMATSTSPITTTPSTAFPPVQDGTTTTNSDASAQDAILMQQELAQLRQQNAQLQSQMTSLQRDLAAETRARTRTAVAMQDTRDKFEMLSAVAYKKLKEMIFQRHVLEMEVRELRAQVDLQSEVNVVQQGEMLFRQEQQMRQLQQQQAA
ncbi:hypothetical protein BG011_005049 [Mortierella polycephala]|uniref:Uncharacterized protein n=1 Tax=Mortierella polycephala TaxID=41804 RepID=A0A9P6PWL4_9FUNG|nr:hypothetical protein BG011_005049 [Mortierella polycephala]